MHELSICLSLLQQLETIAKERNASAVERVYLKIGPLSGIEPHLLRQAYPLAVAGTVAENAELIIETADVVVTCTQCGSESKVLPNRLLCADCGDFRTRIISGDDMILQRLELTIQDTALADTR
jgi:hydrogenase nickel incorporation protein HypA/HybF